MQAIDYKDYSFNAYLVQLQAQYMQNSN